MSRRRSLPSRANYDAPAICHDHFDGSANCIECGGPCALSDEQIPYTALVRSVFESLAFNGMTPPYAMLRTMKRAGLNADGLWGRALETNCRRVPTPKAEPSPSDSKEQK